MLSLSWAWVDIRTPITERSSRSVQLVDECHQRSSINAKVISMEARRKVGTIFLPHERIIANVCI